MVSANVVRRSPLGLIVAKGPFVVADLAPADQRSFRLKLVS